MHYAILIQTTQSANDSINEIVASASRENRELTSEEVASMIGSYATLASNSGQSMSDIAGAQDFLSANMKNMVTNVGIDALVQAGVLSESAASQIGSLGSVQDKIGALKGALDTYNATGVPPKSIVVNSNAYEVATATTNTLRNIPDEEVIVRVKQQITESTKYTTALGIGHATGTDSHPGGPAILGDGGREEPYLTPSGTFGISPSIDTLFPDLPRGTKVWPSIQNFKLDIPHFATGVEGSTEAQRLIASFGKRESFGENTGSNNIDNSNHTTTEIHNHFNITAYGELPNKTVKNITEKISRELKNTNDRKIINRGEKVH